MVIQHTEKDSKGIFFVAGESENNYKAEMVYSLPQPDVMVIEHTHVSNELRGQNVGFQLVRAAVEHARVHRLKVTPVCAFAKSVIDKKPEFQDVLAE